MTYQPLYRAATAALLVTVVTKDVPWFVIGGSSTKRVLVRRIGLSHPTLTAAEVLRIGCQKLSTATTGGTATALVKVPLGGPASTLSLCQVYTAAPTSGTLVGNVEVKRVAALTATPVATDSRGEVVFDFRDPDGDGGVPLDGVAENLSLVFLEANAGSAVSMHLWVEWTEEG